MSVRSWWNNRELRSRAKRRRRAAAANRDEPLREFVYLDEVSVYSLMASRIGALVTEFTETESTSLASEIKGGAGVSAPVAKASVSSSLKAAEGSETQVMRKSTIQSTFKELYSYVSDELVIGPPLTTENVPAIGVPADLGREADKASSPWVVDAAELERGHLVELEVELDTDVHFRVSTVLSTVLDFMDSMQDMPNMVDPQELLTAEIGTRLLEKLLVGLVPLQGVAVDYAFVALDDRELLVHTRALEQLPDVAVEALEVRVVGVAEEELFWRDIRRVLFSRSRYRMLCRLGRAGARRDWTPVKLMDVLGDALPPFRDAVDEIPRMLDSMAHANKVEDDAEHQMRRALVRYALDLSTAFDHPLTEADLSGCGLPTGEQVSGYATHEERRAAFEGFTAALNEAFGFSPSPEVTAAYRGTALIEAGLIAPGSVVADEANDSSGPEVSGPVEDVRYLDCEVVAIYW